MKRYANKATKKELRAELRLTRPPRLEGASKNAMMDPVHKKKHAARRGTSTLKKPQGYSEKERKDYQLRSRRR